MYEHAPEAAPAPGSSPPLAVGWSEGDVAMLQELAEIGMTQARVLAAEAQAHLALVQKGEASPLTPSEIAKARLDFMRVSRAIRLTLALKAHARGAGHNPTRAAIAAEAEPAPFAVLLPRPFSDDDPEDEAGWARAQAEAARADLAPVVEALSTGPAEAERLRERIERGIEREQETCRVFGVHQGIVQAIMQDLGLGPVRWRPVQTRDGQSLGEIVALPGEPSYEDPLIVPDGVDPHDHLRTLRTAARLRPDPDKPPDTG